jgi:hypothetical protein
MRAMSPREEEYRDKGVEILAINCFEEPQVGKDWIASSGLELSWAFADDEAIQALGVNTFPTQIILDRGGKVVWTSGFSSAFGGPEDVFAALDAAL